MPSSADSKRYLSWLSLHTLRQLKFILPGAAVTYYLQSHLVFYHVFEDNGTWGKYVYVQPLHPNPLVPDRSSYEMRSCVCVSQNRITSFASVGFPDSHTLPVPPSPPTATRPGAQRKSHPQIVRRTDRLTRDQYRQWRESGIVSTVIPVRPPLRARKRTR